MDRVRTNPPGDPEFEGPGLGPRLGELDGEPEKYLRLLANPFLCFLFLDAWMAAMYQSVAGGFAGPLTPTLLVVLVAALGLVPMLAHFHCMDCGVTGRLLRWRKHSCHKSYERRIQARPRITGLPSPPLQMVLWIWIVMTAALVFNASGLRP